MAKKFVTQEYSVSRQGKNIKDGTKRTKHAAWLSGTFFSISLVFSLCLVAFTIVFFFSPVFGSSMMATINADLINDNWPVGDAQHYNADSVIVNKFKKPGRGDIIVVKHYHDETQDSYHDKNGYYSLFIKRLIAFGGESIYFDRKGIEGTPAFEYTIYIDGVPLAEDYLIGNDWGHNVAFGDYYDYQTDPNTCPKKGYNGIGSVPSTQATYNWYDANNEPYFKYNKESERNELVLPDNYMFYMGDNRCGIINSPNFDNRNPLKSMDCTAFGPQPYSCLMGTVTEILKKENAVHFAFRKVGEFFTFRWLFKY